MKTIPVLDEAHWHSLRARSIGASESAALFGLSPYATRFMLWHDKKGTMPLAEPGSERVDWGHLLEPAIAKGVAAEMRWTLESRQVYCMSDTVAGMGCTIDFWIVDHENGPGIVEVKNIDWKRWKDTWTEESAAPHIEVQMQHQLAVTGFAWGAIAALVGGNDLRIYERKPHAETIAAIEREVAAFWRAIEAGEEPDPFGAGIELATLRELCRPVERTRIDLTGDYEAFELADRIAWAKEQRRFHEVIEKDAMVPFLHKVGTAEMVTLPGFDVRRRKDGAFHKFAKLPGAQPPAAADPDVSPFI